ncbi:MAG: hypothetical protein J6V99_01660 [Neisseriaceae bacterium]|nr:hypothetical protein [Neisseriaceae bacterium]
MYGMIKTGNLKVFSMRGISHAGAFFMHGMTKTGNLKVFSMRHFPCRGISHTWNDKNRQPETF